MNASFYDSISTWEGVRALLGIFHVLCEAKILYFVPFFC